MKKEVNKTFIASCCEDPDFNVSRDITVVQVLDHKGDTVGTCQYITNIKQYPRRELIVIRGTTHQPINSVHDKSLDTTGEFMYEIVGMGENVLGYSIGTKVLIQDFKQCQLVQVDGNKEDKETLENYLRKLNKEDYQIEEGRLKQLQNCEETGNFPRIRMVNYFLTSHFNIALVKV